MKIKVSKYQIFLIAAFLAVWVWAAIEPNYRDGWLLENYLVFIFVPLILIISIYFKLSDLSYTLITLFMIMHVIGSHYTYAEVPFGYMLQDWFDSSRNMYDRLVHFSFGLLLAYPLREVFYRVAKSKGIWGFYFPVELTLGLAAIYELIEWGVVIVTNPQAGLGFLGAQGDIWDAQKDMMLAGVGSIITMTVVLIINIIYNPGFKKEMRESVKISRDDEPMGEYKLSRWLGERKKKVKARK
jgi:putative membrane protein